jgi:Domain of unknown function (DUF5664)
MIKEIKGREMEKGDRVYHKEFGIGTIKDIPVPSTAWVKFDKDTDDSERGIGIFMLEKYAGGLNTASGMAKRFNSGKTRFSLIPVKAEEAESKVWTMGAEKYGERNWEKGLPFLSVIDSMLRHIKAYQKGETIDSESGQPHMAHIRCNAAMLIEYQETHPELDDRKG